jgi:3-oxoadipate enol-lactonase
MGTPLPLRDLQMFIHEAGAGPALVFIHGLGWDHRLWLASLARYERGFRVILGDTRGHGQSDKPPGPYSIAQFADDWIQALDALSVERAIVVGFSQGGMAAQIMAARRPDLVRGLVLACTASHVTPESSAIMAQRVQTQLNEGPRAGAIAAANSIFSPAFIKAHPAYIDDFLSERVAQDQAALLAASQAGKGFDVRDDLPSIRVPVLVIAAEEDRLCSAASLQALAQSLPRARFVQIRGSGHMAPVEASEQFHDLLDEYLEIVLEEVPS